MAVLKVVAPVTPSVELYVPVVNAAVPGVTLPIACACSPPAVAVESVVAPVTPSVELNVPVVNAPVLAELAPIGAPSTLPPVITALPVLKFVDCNVVIFPRVAFIPYTVNPPFASSCKVVPPSSIVLPDRYNVPNLCVGSPKLYVILADGIR